MTEAWAIAVGLSKNDNLMGDTTSNSVVTCQFRRDFGAGVRLNTPGPLQKFSTGPDEIPDVAAALLTPLNYEDLYGMVFKLDHFFCGYPGVMNCPSQPDTIIHTTGFGMLKMSDQDGNLQREDYRAYSSKVFYSAGVGSPIKSLGAHVSNTGGMGRMSIRIRRFTVWQNTPPLHPQG
ncbi:MAG TPA: hypothetical protein VJT71_10600 [Pyrinomonadaceae bacterium]|nr:hypothetical protein [Pyrinomonadaceae bacterium]